MRGGGPLHLATAHASDVELDDLAGLDARQQLHRVQIERERKREKKIKRLREEEDMKFSHSVQFNAVPDWSSHYISYSNLKKL